MAKSDKTVKVINEQGPMGWIFFTAWIGAAVYFVNMANGFWDVVLALLKSIVWPAYLLFYVLESLGVR